MAPRQRLSQQPSDDVDHSESTSLMDKKFKKSLTLNQTEADIARDWHDYFNLIALVRTFGRKTCVKSVLLYR